MKDKYIKKLENQLFFEWIDDLELKNQLS